jgi:hypothetical protein
MDQRVAIMFAIVAALSLLAGTTISGPAYAVVGGGPVEVVCAGPIGTSGILITNTPHIGTVVVFNAPCVPPFSKSP